MKTAFGDKLRELRKENGKTQAEIAIQFGVSKTTICQWETKKQEPSLMDLIKIAIYFNVTADYLLGLEDESGTKIYNTYNNNGTHIGDVKF